MRRVLICIAAMGSSGWLFAEDGVEQAPVVPPAKDEAGHRDALSRFGVARLNSRNDLPLRAIRELESAAKSDPQSIEPTKELVKLYEKLGRRPAAMRAARKVLASHPEDMSTGHTLGGMLYEYKRFAEAALVLRHAADSPEAMKSPVHRLAILRDAARAYDAAQDWDAALAALRDAEQLITMKRKELLISPAFSSITELESERAALHEKIGGCLVQKKQFDDACATFREAAELYRTIDPNSAARIDWNLTQAFAAKGDAPKAMDHLKRFLSLKPSEPSPYEKFAELSRRTGQSEQAMLDDLAKYARENPKNESIRWILAEEIGRKDADEGEREFRTLMPATTEERFFKRFVHFELESGRGTKLLDLADELYLAAKPKELRQAFQDEPEKLVALSVERRKATERARAFTQAVRNDPAAARVLLNAAAQDPKKSSRSADTSDLLASLADRVGDEDAYEKFLFAAYREKRELFYRLERHLETKRKWKECLKLCDEDRLRGKDRTYEKIHPLVELGRNDEALQNLDVFVKANPIEGRLEKARFLDLMGRSEESLKLAREAFDLASTPKQVHSARVRLAETYNSLKQFEKAEAELRAILDEDPDDVNTLNNLGYNLADQGRKLAEAEEMIRHAIELDTDANLRDGSVEPENGVYVDSLAWVRFRRGDTAAAKEMLEKATRAKFSATDAIVWDHYGDVLYRAGEKAAARTAWEKAAKLSTDSLEAAKGGRRLEILRKLKQTE